ncbi:ribosomal-protein-alanine acetyltransferase [Clostridia bacterium]|nr:ribosomal-protein-alanine acetyltransferase [Clostridia bacterium]
MQLIPGQKPHNDTNIIIAKMKPIHLDGVLAVENASFSVPWSARSLSDELLNKHAYYFVALSGNEVIGYCGMWHIVNEGHITKIAVRADYRRQGVGAMLIEELCLLAKRKRMIGLTLEVRMNNRAAHALYAKCGFKPEGIRKSYYSDTKEDAVVMWKYF